MSVLCEELLTPEQRVDLDHASAEHGPVYATRRRREILYRNAAYCPWRPTLNQRLLERCDKRFVVVPAGRRSGKTKIAKRKLVATAIGETRWPDARFFAAAPTRDQAKQIYWADLKRMVPRSLIQGEPRESELIIPLYNGAEIHVVGMDKPQRIEGRPWNGGVLDEYGDMKKEALDENIRPALTDRHGWLWLIGVPEGRNHYFDTFTKAKSPEYADEWTSFTWTSAEVLPQYLGYVESRRLGITDPRAIAKLGHDLAAAEIASAKRDLDPLTYDQEYNASFVTFEGRAYYMFKAEKHAAVSLSYRPDIHELIFCFDFNRSPGIAVVCQEVADKTHVIGEVYIPKNSTTPAVCRKLIADWSHHKGRVLCYGDATGGAKGTAKVAGSDWDIIETMLRPVFGNMLYMNVPDSNPRERARVNAVNSRLESTTGEVRMLIDPVKAKWTARDLDSVVTLKGGAGEIDKDADSALTHLSDALGYYIEKEFPAGGGHRTVTKAM